MYNIPNDNYVDFRINMFSEYHKRMESFNDSGICNLKSLCNSENKEDVVWISFLYSTCYSVATTAFLFHHFPTLQSATKESLNQFWLQNKKDLLFQSDRRWVRSLDKFVSIILSYKSKIGESSQYVVVSNLMKSSQTEVFNWFTSIYYCGRFSAMLFMECLYGLLGLELTQESYLDWNSCKTCAQGILVIYYQDNLAFEIDKFKGTRDLSKTEQNWLENALFYIISYTEQYIGRKANFARIISDLCGYYKLYKKNSVS